MTPRTSFYRSDGRIAKTSIAEIDLQHRIAGRATVIDENGQPIFVGPPFEIVGVGDVTGDRKAGIVWHHGGTGETQIWRMDGHRIRERASMIGENVQPAFVGPPFRIVGVGDVG
jgi:hypothetical protein